MNGKQFGQVFRLLPVCLTMLLGVVLLAAPGKAAPAWQSDADPAPPPNNIERVLYFDSDVRDAADCVVTVDGEQISFGEGVTNPAMTCPDAFAWTLLVKAVSQEFWRNWAADNQTWPAEPYPLCGSAQDKGAGCCQPGATDNPGYEDQEDPSQHCPFYPGDFDGANGTIIPHQANPQSKAHLTAFHGTLPATDEEGRVIRQEMAEVVFRNKPLFDYVFTNNLYNSAGLGDAFTSAANAKENRSPYRVRNGADGIVHIDFPVASVMLKTNWLNAERARELGIVDDADNPYIKMEIESPVVDNNGSTMEPGMHYLVAAHVSSKDLPNWVWATFEHVDNPGRCDYTGCNDSFGYASPDSLEDGLWDNFTMPNLMDDGLVISSTVFAPGGLYDSGPRSDELGALFDAFGIGSTDQSDALPAMTDKGWLSYRLKGAQVAFTDATGWPTRLGNSITEGGFVGTSSCIACHARASVDATGGPAQGVFQPELSNVGYEQSNRGAPNPYWFYRSDFHFSLEALPTDFVWGILAAQPLVEPGE